MENKTGFVEIVCDNALVDRLGSLIQQMRDEGHPTMIIDLSLVRVLAMDLSVNPDPNALDAFVDNLISNVNMIRELPTAKRIRKRLAGE